MTAALAGIINKYQDVASKQVIQAVQKASTRTGVDFAFLMQKASTESGFNPSAKAKSSSATGLYQFIEDTWLKMVKNHGDKYGLGAYADKITIKPNGQACVEDCDLEKEILALRKNPEIAALMAGEFSAENKAYLERNTKSDVGGTELYLAHFMGAGAATKFLNSRNANGDVNAAAIFPAAAKANKTVFYHPGGQPRTLDEIYSFFDKKFTGGTVEPSDSRKARPAPPAEVRSAAAPAADLLPLDLAARALPSFDDTDESDDIIWNDDPRFFPEPRNAEPLPASRPFRGADGHGNAA